MTDSSVRAVTADSLVIRDRGYMTYATITPVAGLHCGGRRAVMSTQCCLFWQRRWDMLTFSAPRSICTSNPVNCMMRRIVWMLTSILTGSANNDFQLPCHSLLPQLPDR